MSNREHIAAMQRVLDRFEGAQPPAASVVQYLELEGFTLVPTTIIGVAGWTPSEENAFRAGVMWERYEKRTPHGKLPEL